jgi:ribonuclease HI
LGTFGPEHPTASNQIWTIFVDGAWGHSGARASAILVAPSGLQIKYAARLEFRATNNIAEYEGLILGLNKAKALGAKTLLVKTDSQVLAGQVEKKYMAREPELVKYLAMVRALERRFQRFTLKYIPRLENAEADALVKAASKNLPILEGTFYQVLGSPATETASKAFQMVLLTECEDWRQAITDALHNTFNLEDEANVIRMAARARNYTLIDGNLYKKGVVQPLLKCISQGEGRELLQEIHLGICGSDIGLRALPAKDIR